MCYKIVQELIDLTLSDFFSFDNKGHSSKLVKQHSLVKARVNFFANRVINVWNSLPEDIVSASSLGALEVVSVTLICLCTVLVDLISFIFA